MFMRSAMTILLIAASALATFGLQRPAPAGRLGLGSALSADEARSVDIAVGPDGSNLPPGRGTAKEGESIYAAKCAGCHGADGAGGPYDQLVGGKLPVKTIGTYWPYATTVFDYTRRAMPFGQPGSLSDTEVYALTAWMLWKNNIISDGAVIDATTLPQVKMPNRNGFVADPRPDVPGKPGKRRP